VKYDTARIIAEIRRCQPNILIFNMWDPDTKWVGNECGIAHSPNKLTVGALDVCINKDIQDLLDPPRCLPTECDCRMRQHNWFYSDSDVQTVKSLDELMGLYYYSVGRGANLLLNIGPDRRGKLPPEDKAALLRFGEKLREVFSDFIPCEQAQEGQTLTLRMEPQLINQVILSEEPDPNCEIGHFEIKAYPYEYGTPITVFHGTSIGHKAICMFPTLKTQRVDVVFDRPKKVEAKLQYRPMFL